MNVIMSFLIGQHVTLDIVMPPFGALPPQVRPPTLPDSWSHPQLSLVIQYLGKFQEQWPVGMRIRGCLVDRYKYRIRFLHLNFTPLCWYGAVNRLWLRLTVQQARQYARVNLRVSRGLPASYQLVDTIVLLDVQGESHLQTECEILCTLRCLFAKSPLS